MELQVDKPTYQLNDKVRVSFSDPVPSNESDRAWICLVPAESDDSLYGQWSYVEHNAQEVLFNARGAGDYEVRLHTGYPDKSYHVVARAALTVEAAQFEWNDAMSFELADTEIVADKPFTLEFGMPLPSPAEQRFWIAVVPDGADDSEYGNWTFVDDGAKSVQIAAHAHGPHQIRLHANYASEPYCVMQRLNIEVQQAPEAPRPPSEQVAVGDMPRPVDDWTINRVNDAIIKLDNAITAYGKPDEVRIETRPIDMAEANQLEFSGALPPAYICLVETFGRLVVHVDPQSKLASASFPFGGRTTERALLHISDIIDTWYVSRDFRETNAIAHRYVVFHHGFWGDRGYAFDLAEASSVDGECPVLSFREKHLGTDQFPPTAEWPSFLDWLDWEVDRLVGLLCA